MNKGYGVFTHIYNKLIDMQIKWVGLNLRERCIMIKQYHNLYIGYIDIIYTILKGEDYEKYQYIIDIIDSKIIEFEQSKKRFHQTLKILLEEKGVGRK